MPVDSQHSEYKKRLPQWKRCRDTIDGTDAVKGNKTIYLPSLGGQSDDEYTAYLMRALFYGASGRTVQGLMGAVFRKDYNVQYPFDEQLEDITPSGLALKEFSRTVIREVLTTGRLGLLVDVSDQRPYTSTYSAENIINWQVMKIAGRSQLSMVVLKETYEQERDNDIFTTDTKPQYRVLSLEFQNGGGYKYKQDIYRKVEAHGKEEWVLVPGKTIYPSRSGVPFDYIPFQFINMHDLTTCTDKPPLKELVDVNLSHYRTSADLEHGAHFTALPTPWIAGFDAKNEYRIGSGVAWVSGDTDAKVGMLEYTGQGLKALEERLGKKETMMAVLGARMLEEPKRAVEAADTQKLRRSGETGSLAAIVGTASDGIKQILKWMAEWSGASEAQLKEIEFELNSDFYDIEMDPQQLTALMGAVQSSHISQDTFLWNLKTGEILPPGRTIEEEKDLIQSEAPSDLGTEFGNNVTPIKRSITARRDASGNYVVEET